MYISYNTIKRSINNINHLNCTTMYQITKKVLNIANNVISESVFANIDCSTGDLIYTIAPKLHNLAKADNANYSIHGRSFHTVFVVKQISIYSVSELSNIIEIKIKDNVRHINAHAIRLNDAARESNKRNRRKANTNFIKPVDVKDYLLTFESINYFVDVNGEIEIK